MIEYLPLVSDNTVNSNKSIIIDNCSLFERMIHYENPTDSHH